MLFKIHTLGCKVNRYESDCIRSELILRGHKPAGTLSPDLIILNSCTVTSSSDKKTNKLLRSFRRDNPLAIIVLAGCMPQAFPEKASEVYDADIVVGTKNKSELIRLAEKFAESRIRLVKISQYGGDEPFESSLCSDFAGRTRAEIKIQDGCDCFCSYCIIPYARGAVRSKPIAEIEEEVLKIAEAGYREIVITGINIAAYGKDFSTHADLVDAVKACSAPSGISRVRLGSLEANLLSCDMISRLAKHDKLCPHFHLSLQSGCEKTLREMNRKYNPQDFRSLVECIRNHFHECAITTDIIAGFPGESDKDFMESLNFFREMKFAQAHVFPYSPRDGTAAANRTDMVEDGVKAKRAELLRHAAKEAREKFISTRVGMTVPVLFERENDTKFHLGHAPDYTMVKIPAKKSRKSLQNQIFCVTIKKHVCDICFGEIADSKPMG